MYNKRCKVSTGLNAYPQIISLRIYQHRNWEFRSKSMGKQLIKKLECMYTIMNLYYMCTEMACDQNKKNKLVPANGHCTLYGKGVNHLQREKRWNARQNTRKCSWNVLKRFRKTNLAVFLIVIECYFWWWFLLNNKTQNLKLIEIVKFMSTRVEVYTRAE